MKLFNRIGVVVLSLLCCLAIGLQLVYEDGAIVQGFPASRLFLIVFYWQIANVPMVLLAATLGILKTVRYRSVPVVLASLSATYPTVVAIYALWPSNWHGWLSDFKAFPQEAILKLSVALFPALCTLALAAVFLKQDRNQLRSKVTPWQR